MAIAHRCDRCGTLYIPKYTEDDDGYIEIQEEPFLIKATDLKTKPTKYWSVDLCTDCTADLIAWFIGRNHGRAKLQEYGIIDKF